MACKLCHINAIVNQAATFVITNTKLDDSVVTLSTQDKAKLLQKLKSGFEVMLIWNKYQSKVSIQNRNQYLKYLIDPSFKGVNHLCYHSKIIHIAEVMKRCLLSSSCKNKRL